MLLKKFEVFGFKSFADKTELEFSPGINAIVGPNGSGKSNISDAIRWALGEQSIRTLRGAKMEDVIFAGTTHRKPLGVAEVSLTFDNYDALLPLDYGEVTVTRRVFRSGESEYLINKSQCRLKDLHELLAGTGLGRESMAVIGQNKIDEILNSKPEERRLLFEEVIGIARFKQRRKDAVRKMDDTEQNLTRVRDIIAEIESQLDPLKASADKTNRYNRLYAQFVQCKTTLYINRYDTAQTQLTALAANEKKALDAAIAAMTQTSVAESERELVGAELSNADEQLLYYDRILAASSLTLQKTDGQIQVGRERLEHIGQRREKLIGEKNALTARLEFLDGSLSECREKLAVLQAEEAAATRELNEAAALLNNSRRQSKICSNRFMKRGIWFSTNCRKSLMNETICARLNARLRIWPSRRTVSTVKWTRFPTNTRQPGICCGPRKSSCSNRPLCCKRWNASRQRWAGSANRCRWICANNNSVNNN